MPDQSGARRTPRRARSSSRAPAAREGSRQEPLARYTTEDGVRREIITCPGAEDRTLVIDRDTRKHDTGLIAALAPDEPTDNALLLARMYVADTTGRYCRALERADLLGPGEEPSSAGRDQRRLLPESLTDRRGNTYRIVETMTGAGTVQRAWTRLTPGETPPRRVSLRQVVGAMEDYQPAVATTERAVAIERSTARLARELERLRRSPIVLNRRLREAVLAALARDDLGLGEVAIRCGRTERCGDGGRCADGVWVARRIGLMPEGGKAEPSAFIDSRLLALIARAVGLDVVDVEVPL
jgi:hypothetical protein